MRPNFSIIIPSFNKASFIQETLDSITEQTYTNWEAIVVDDGSSDNSVSIIKEYCIKDKRFKLLQRKILPKGGSACRNIGLHYSTGRVIMFLDADDILQANCLINRLHKINNYPLIDFAVFSGGTFYKEIGDSKSTWTPPLSRDYLKLFLAHTLPWNTTSVLWKAEYLKLICGFNEEFQRLQDVELHTRALLYHDVSFKVFDDEPDFFYRIDENRKIKDPYSFLLMLIESVHKYYNYFSGVLRDNKKYHRYLNGTIQSAYISVQNQYDAGFIRIEERNKLFDIIDNNFKDKSLLIKMYVTGLKYGIHKVKGYNFIMKKIITLT
jgi:glycosyltransferase involved in cell wall biosynthesis